MGTRSNAHGQRPWGRRHLLPIPGNAGPVISQRLFKQWSENGQLSLRSARRNVLYEGAAWDGPQ
eukprot:155237-Ditylum_brightwellii.AAC.1